MRGKTEANSIEAGGGAGPDGGRGPHGDTWPVFAHDFQRTSRALGAGALTAPQVAWSLPMGGLLGPSTAAVADVDGDGRPNPVTITGGRVTATSPDGSTLWQGSLAGAQAVLGVWNLDGIGAPEVVVDSPGGVQVLDGATGRQLTFLATIAHEASAAFAPLGSTGGILLLSQTGTSLAGYDFRQGTQVTAPLWTTTAEDPVAVVAGDVDGDGSIDLVRALDTGFQVLDPLTGLTKYEDDFAGPPGYLYTFQLANVDSTPGLEIVVIHSSYIYSPPAGIYVLGVRSGALVTLWSSVVSAQYALDAQLTTVAGAIADLDGDGTMEMVYSQWDGPSQTWTTQIVDAPTGTPIAALSGQVVQALADLDGNGKTEIVTRSGPLADLTPPTSTVSAYDFVSRTSPPTARPWALSNAQVVTMSTAVASANGGAPIPAVAELDTAAGSDLLVALDPGQTGTVTELGILNGDGTLTSTLAAPAHTAPSVLWWGNGLTSASSQSDVLELGNDGIAQCLTGALAKSASFAAGSYANWLNVYGLDADRTMLAMATSTTDLLWLDGTHLHSDGTPYQMASVPGVVDTSGLAAGGAGLSTMTLLGGPSPTLVAFAQGQTAITMVAMDTAGVQIWRTPLAAGATLLMPGPYAQDLTGDGVPDLLLPQFDINSLESLAIFDGTTGAIVQSTPLQTIAPTGDQTQTGSLIDVNGDGVPDLVTPLHDIGQIAIDLTKNPMSALWTLTPASLAVTAISGTIAAAPVDDQGPTLLRFNGNVGDGPYERYSLGGSLLAYFDEGLAFMDGADKNVVALVQRTAGATVFDMISAGTSGAGLSRVRRIAGDTIGTEWTEYVANGVVAQTQPTQTFALHDPVAFDVDGDGTDEVVFGSDDGWLYALHAIDGSLAFAMNLGAPVLHVIAADIDLDPALEIEASLGDGRLVAIDGAGHYATVRDPPASTDAGSSATETDSASETDSGTSPCVPDDAGVDVPQHASCSLGGGGEGGTGNHYAAILAVGLAASAVRRRRARGDSAFLA